ncbi:hypothetical protein KFZ76_02570 [Methylovulum psychrotolerans]|uniref:hypothetical protein n=1 Tax=Methylovulum psychrotolerans TaxID=1704499 RepID=UPI001BFF1932|nr:hypothetical protein [Methylovulum psychrotolerans]MBT9096595.1 hypothetical protein [Methylovulum psychrotolerans]
MPRWSLSAGKMAAARDYGDGQVAEPDVFLLADTVVAVAAAQVVGLAVSHKPARVQGGAGF